MERYSVEVKAEELELRLGCGRLPHCFTDINRRNGVADLVSSEDRSGQITIFYNGHVSVCTITDFQARTIMEMAKNEMSRSMELSLTNGKQENKKELPFPRETFSVSQLLNPGLSMKRSLQRFLQMRKRRMADLSCSYGYRQKPLQHLSLS